MNNHELYRALGARMSGARVVAVTPDGTKYDVIDVAGVGDDTVITLVECTEPDDPRVEKIARALCEDDERHGVGGDYALFADNYRSNARAVLAVLDADEVKTPASLAVGDYIRVLKNGLEGADVSSGEELRVTRVGPTTFGVHDFGRDNKWTFALESTGWERA